MTARIPTVMSVLFGIVTSVISRPSNPLIGVDRGRMVSCLVLNPSQMHLINCRDKKEMNKQGKLTYVLRIKGMGG